MFSETPILTRATWCNIPEDIRHCYRCENTPGDSILRPYISVPYSDCNHNFFYYLSANLQST
jgi:hypothetical protein